MDSKQVRRRAALRHRATLVVEGEPLDNPLAELLATATRIASYVPIVGEPGLPPRQGWLLPVLLPDGDLDWAAYDGQLAPAAYGLREPQGPRLGRAALASCDLVLVPALLVDRRGSRLGRGGGSYDRALTRATGLTVALLHDGELVDELPTEPHDVRVLAAATPSQGVVLLGGS